MDMVSDSTLQPTFKKRLLVEFWCSIREEYTQLKGYSNIPIGISNYWPCEVRFSPSTSAKTIYWHRLSAETSENSAVSHFSQKIKEFCQNIKPATLPLNFHFGKNSNFSLDIRYLYYNVMSILLLLNVHIWIFLIPQFWFLGL